VELYQRALAMEPQHMQLREHINYLTQRINVEAARQKREVLAKGFQEKRVSPFGDQGRGAEGVSSFE
jgi:hypothetical protein